MIDSIKERIIRIGHGLDELMDLPSDKMTRQSLEDLLQAINNVRQETIMLATEFGDLGLFLTAREAEVEKIKNEVDTNKGLNKEALLGYINSEIAGLSSEYTKAKAKEDKPKAYYLYGCITGLQRLIEGINRDLFKNDEGVVI